ncbi:MAG: Carbon-monoxide dehydrogenase large subunit, partial [Hyphomicrobiales bacterium]|nr:Carbon-monoxide dehydrogenase large subunit [Hyphomicrobiales bacterium]
MSVQFKGRREDFRLVTGQGRYTSDFNFPRQAYGFFLRADRAHAQIVSVDAAAARACPGVLAVFTGKETQEAGFAPIPPMVKYPGRGGMKLLETGRDVLAETHIRYSGQPIAFVVAETLNQAMDAAEQIVVDIRDLPVVVDAGKALEPGAPQLYADIPGNLVFDYEYGDRAKTDAALAQAA